MKPRNSLERHVHYLDHDGLYALGTASIEADQVWWNSTSYLVRVKL